MAITAPFAGALERVGISGWIIKSKWEIYRGYYTVARRYEFYVQEARTISHE